MSRIRRRHLLSSRQVADVLPALLRRAHGEDNALSKGVHGVHQLQLSITTKGDHLQEPGGGGGEGEGKKETRPHVRVYTHLVFLCIVLSAFCVLIRLLP